VTIGTGLCKKDLTKLTDIPRKLSFDVDSLEIMKIKTAIARRATWRDRFVEIGRQVGSTEVRAPAALAAGLRPRARMGGFAMLRRPVAR